jgi:hypothetical protein
MAKVRRILQWARRVVLLALLPSGRFENTNGT